MVFFQEDAMTKEEWEKRAEEAKKAVDDWKATKDTDTRREVRAIWALIGVGAVFATIGICYLVM